VANMMLLASELVWLLESICVHDSNAYTCDNQKRRVSEERRKVPEVLLTRN